MAIGHFNISWHSPMIPMIGSEHDATSLCLRDRRDKSEGVLRSNNLPPAPNVFVFAANILARSVCLESLLRASMHAWMIECEFMFGGVPVYVENAERVRIYVGMY